MHSSHGAGVALFCQTVRLAFEVLEPNKRPISACADAFEVRDVVKVDVALDETLRLTMLFDPEHDLEERIPIGSSRQRILKSVHSRLSSVSCTKSATPEVVIRFAASHRVLAQ